MSFRASTEGVIARILALRIPILVLFAVLLPLAIHAALEIPTHPGIDRLVIATDPDVVATRAFQQIFPETDLVLLIAEADAPLDIEPVAAFEALERSIAAIQNVKVYSALSLYRRANPTFSSARPEDIEAFRRFASGSKQLRRQGLVGDRGLGLAIAFPRTTPADRDAILAAVDAAAAKRPALIASLRKVGKPYIESWIEHASTTASLRYFPLFGLFVVAITWFLYRSFRTLAAILLALGASVALAVGAGRTLEFSFTLVSSLVPLTVMVTALANLVYLHSRYVDQPPDVSLERHHIQAIVNKALPITVSNLAAVLGFAALSVSDIRPVREMGQWTAIGLVAAWLVTFTLFPALERVLSTPTGRVLPIRTRLYDQLAARVPHLTRELRFVLVPTSLVLALAGLAALVGVPGYLAPMRVGVDPIDYVDPSLPLRADTAFFREHIGGLSLARVWLQVPEDTSITDSEVLRGIERLTTRLEAFPDVSSVVGPTTLARMRRYLAGEGETLPDTPETFAALAQDIEQLMLSEPELRGFIDPTTLTNAHLMITFKRTDPEGADAIREAVRAAFAEVKAETPALGGADVQVVGESMLHTKVGKNLVPTLTESFVLTAVLIFFAFLLVFRSPSARLMAMIPSLFAILVTFLGMRLFGAELNVATILIATTVLGTTENDQIHFFHHLEEGGPELGDALSHTLRVSGRAIVFATLINCAGFLGLAFSTFPPMRQFGIITAAAFILAMVADFTALPAALWIARKRQAERRVG